LELYRISGINKLQKYYFGQYFSKENEVFRDRLINELAIYYQNIKRQLRFAQLDDSSLGFNSRVALFNIKGLITLHQKADSKYVQIYRIFQKEASEVRKINHKTLILNFTASKQLRHQIINSANSIHVSLSFSAVNMPIEYFSYLAKILYAKATGRSVKREWRERLFDFEENIKPIAPEPVNVSDSSQARGQYFDLLQIFQRINQEYFQNQFNLPSLRWSKRLNRYRLGAYNRQRNEIVISKILDQKNVPVFVIEGILYHEMLHIIHPIARNNGRLIIHGTDFQKDEKKFKFHRQYINWLKHDFFELVKKQKRRKFII